MANTKLLATNESAVEKNPRLRLMIVRSSSLRPSSDFHSAMSAVMFTSWGIQWLAQPSKYFCHAHSYLNGTSWFRSARQLIIAFWSTVTRSELSAATEATGASATGSAATGAGVGSTTGAGAAACTAGCATGGAVYWGAAISTALCTELCTELCTAADSSAATLSVAAWAITAWSLLGASS